MSGYALRALILIALDGRDGQWCRLDWLAERLQLSHLQVQACCDQLKAEGLLQAGLLGDQLAYGVNVA